MTIVIFFSKETRISHGFVSETWNKTCIVVRENIHTPLPTEGTLLYPPPHGISIISNLVGYPLERICPSKVLLHYTDVRKIFFLR